MMSNSRYKWVMVTLLWGVCLLNYADRQAIFSVFPLLKSELGLSDVKLGVIGGSFMWVYAAALPLAGIISDRVRRKFVILGGLVFWSGITLATGWSNTFWQLATFRALEGFGEAFYFPASMSLISAYHGEATRSRAMALHQSSVYAGTILGGALSGLLAQHFGWRLGFYLFGALGVIWGAILIGALREPPGGLSGSRQPEPPAPARGVELAAARLRSAALTRAKLRASVCKMNELARSLGAAARQIFSHPMVTVLILAFIGANFVAAIFLTWMPSFLHRKFGMNLALSGFNATAWLQIASVLGVLSGGWLADRWARRAPAGRMLTQTVGLAAGVPFIFLTGWTGSVPALVWAMIGFGFLKGLYDANIWASLFDVVPPEHRATALGFMNSLGWLGGGLAPVLIGYASSRAGMSACLSAASLVYLGVAILLASGISLWMPRATPATI